MAKTCTGETAEKGKEELVKMGNPIICDWPYIWQSTYTYVLVCTTQNAPYYTSYKIYYYVNGSSLSMHIYSWFYKLSLCSKKCGHKTMCNMTYLPKC